MARALLLALTLAGGAAHAQVYPAKPIRTVGSSPQEFAATIRAEMAKWARVIREADIRPE